MSPLLETIVDLEANRERVRRKLHGIIEVNRGRFTSIRFRPWPKLISAIEAQWAGGWGRKRDALDRCQVFYSQPWAHRNFLTLKYIQSTLKTSWTSVSVAMSVLDRVAEIKQSDAILCEVSNRKISDRLMRRLGWEPHLSHQRRRHWIKRFYGDYPAELLFEKFSRSID